MTHRVICALWLFVGLGFSSVPSQEKPAEMAEVHIEAVASGSGVELRGVKVTLFRSLESGEDYVERFRGLNGLHIPPGLYRLRVSADGFWSAERDVAVLEPTVWVVVGMHIGMDYMLNGRLSGTVVAQPSAVESLWIRLVSIRASTLRDAKVREDGAFTIGSVPDDTYVLMLWSKGRVLHTTVVSVPQRERLVIDLRTANAQR